MKRIFCAFCCSLIGVIFVSDLALADNRQLLGTYRDWDAFMLKKSNGEKVCYMISIPKSALPKGLKHGNPFLTVSHKPARKIKNEVNFVVGYNFKKNSRVTMRIDKKRKFRLFTEGDGAWGDDVKSDNAMSQAMKRGSNLVMSALSGRGNDTSYRFSLSGFTAAHNAITKACR
ncbi:MAG: invasion associated locus B family protein [Emcibacter sp.]|nr:invasion associated locus B family protein [Emcibacter sp.]